MAIKALRHVWLVASALALTACAGSPIRIAQTVEQKAYATYGTFVIAEEQAVKLSAPASTLSPVVKGQIIVAFQKAQPAVDTMMKGLNAAEQAKADFDAQKIDKPTFQVVVDNLGGWVAQAAPLVATLVSAVKGVR